MSLIVKTRHATWRTWALLSTFVAVSVASFTLGQPGYDARYALAWGRDLAHGRGVDVHALSAPTPHPLSVAGTAAIGWLPSSVGLDVLRVVSGCAAGAVVVLMVVLAARLGAGPWAAAGCGLAVVAAAPFGLLALGAGNDLPYAALALTGLLEATGGRHRRAVVWLSVAALLRPEAALLGLVVALISRQKAVWWTWAAGTVTAAAAWLGLGLLAGDPLVGLHTAATNAQVNSDPHGLRTAVSQLLPQLSNLAGPVALVCAALTVAVLVARGRVVRAPGVELVLAAVGATLAAYLAQGLTGTPLVTRYLLLPSLLTLLLAMRLPASIRQTWPRLPRALDLTVVAVLLGTVVWVNLDPWGHVWASRTLRSGVLTDLHTAVTEAPDCPITTVRSPAILPAVALETNTPLADMGVGLNPRPGTATLQPRTADAAVIPGFGPSTPLSTQSVLPGVGKITMTTHHWAIYAACN